MNLQETTPVIVDTVLGKVEGAQKGAVCAFKGIPFAQARRWRAPEPASAWVGIRSARQAGDMAPQNPTPLQGLIGTSGGAQSEDCLSLNVWTPGADHGKRPVMVWIHGGAFTTGAGSLGLYTGKHLAALGNVVVVTINYRLGSLGFLRLQDVSGGCIPSTGSEGLLDQVAALKWVQANITAFGGDPNNVTIFGESAGGMSVVAMMASPLARGLYHKAICQSGGGHFGHDREHANRIAEVFVQHAGVPVSALENVPVSALLKAQLELLTEVDARQDPHKLGAMAFQPVVDGNVLTELPIDAIRKGSASHATVMAGTTLEEWKLWTALDAKFHAMDDAKLARWAERMFGEDAEALLASQGGSSPYERYVEMQTCRAFREPTRRLLSAQSKYSPVFAYRFDWRSPAAGGVFGACHAIELGFVFGSYSIKGPDNFFGKGEEADRLHTAMAEAWTAFARDGTPKSSGASWPSRQADNPQLMRLGQSGRTVEVIADGADDAWARLPDAKIGV